MSTSVVARLPADLSSLAVGNRFATIPQNSTTTISNIRRPGPLRGLSYLRNYTSSHLLLREPHAVISASRPVIARAGSDPDPSATTAASQSNPESPTPIHMRTRSATTAGILETMPPRTGGADTRARNESPAVTAPPPLGMPHQLPSIKFNAHQDPRAQRPSLVFTSMARILPSGKEVIKVGRYSERDAQPTHGANVPSFAPVGFKSKVVSRRHCEFWCTGGRWFIKDVKSSSGTFLNHIRLSSPGTESRPFPVNDGDIVQLGIDFKGGEEMIFRCVKIRVELNKGWQVAPSAFKCVFSIMS